MPRKTGEVLRERYRIKRIIGQGGMGNIYLADDLRLQGRLCALKEVIHDRNLPAELLRQARDQFLREATILARLDHPNLPKVSDYFIIEDSDFLVMDFVPGKDLRELMLEARNRGEFLKERDVLFWASQLSDALIYLHTQQPPIVHRDIKPSNLKLTPAGLLKLVDFGLVKVLLSEEVTITVLQGRGTAFYTPLEQYGGDTGHTDIRSDIYAFGATLYHLLTNQPPLEARQQFLNPEALIPPRKINPMISARTERAVLWAMKLHPDERPQSVDEFRQALLGNAEFVVRRPSLATPPTFWESISAPLEKSLFWFGVGLSLISLLITLLR